MMPKLHFLLYGGNILNSYSVKLLDRALDDLDNIYAYIAESLLAPETALKMINDVEQQITSLQEMPQRCSLRRVGAYANKGYRQLFIKNYTIIFRIDEQKSRLSWLRSDIQKAIFDPKLTPA